MDTQNLVARLFAQFVAIAPDMSLSAALHLARMILTDHGQEGALDWIAATQETMQLRLPEHRKRQN